MAIAGWVVAGILAAILLFVGWQIVWFLLNLWNR